MRPTLRSPLHERLIEILTKACLDAGLTQAEVASRIGRPQSFVAKYENGERRIDTVELIELAAAVDSDPVRIMRLLVRRGT